MLGELNKKFTHVALYLDERVNACSLLNIPEKPWKLYTQLLYGHFFLATALFIFGTLCFCLGMQFSGMYSEVNCADGTNIWIPLLNLIVSLTGLFTLRALHLHWPAFIYCLGLCIMLLMMLATIIDSALASARWFKAAKVPHDQWAMNFSWIDLTLTILAILNEIISICILVPLAKYWYQPADS